MAYAAPDQPEHCADHADPEQYGDFPDGGDLAIEQDDQENHEAAGDAFGFKFRQRMEIARITRESDGSGSDRKGSLHERLPDKKEGHQAAPAAGAIGLAQKHVGSASLGHGGAKFGPDEAIESSQE